MAQDGAECGLVELTLKTGRIHGACRRDRGRLAGGFSPSSGSSWGNDEGAALSIERRASTTSRVSGGGVALVDETGQWRASPRGTSNSPPRRESAMQRSSSTRSRFERRSLSTVPMAPTPRSPARSGADSCGELPADRPRAVRSSRVRPTLRGSASPDRRSDARKEGDGGVSARSVVRRGQTARRRFRGRSRGGRRGSPPGSRAPCRRPGV
jgi:hypothetical protein